MFLREWLGLYTQSLFSINQRLIVAVRLGFPGGSVVKNPPATAEDAGDLSLIPGSVRSPGEGNSNLLQYSCLGNPMDRGGWQVIIHGVTKSQK